MCPICWLKKAFTPTKNISSNPSSKSYDPAHGLVELEYFQKQY